MRLTSQVAGRVKRRMGINAMASGRQIIGVGFLALVGVAAMQSFNGPRKQDSSTLPVGSIDPVSVTDIAKREWGYSTSEDKMRGGSEKTASIESKNDLNFGFPYNGGSTGKIEIRQGPRFGFDVMLSVTKGQFMCHSFTGGHISVKFDNRPIEKFGCTNASDGTSNVIFFKNPKRVLSF